MLDNQINYIKSRTDFVPDIAVVLGSGLGGFADKIDKVCEISYKDIEGMPVSTAPTHKGCFVFGNCEGKKVILMQGRIHLYEGYTSQQTVMPIRLMKLLGAKKLILTNASGGINKDFQPGDLMMITDHISSFVPSPLIGYNYDSLGQRFPDMSNAYSKKLCDVIKKSAQSRGIAIQQGVYAQLTGPQFESPAEIRMLSRLGTDAVGMSTVTEAVAAVHCGFEVCGISLIANLACGLTDKPLSSDEVTQTADDNAEKFIALITEVIKNIDG